MITLHGKNIIGNTISGNSETQFKGYGVATETLANTDFYEATADEINTAVGIADVAFAQFKKTSGKQKAAFLKSIADEIELLDTVLIETASNESGLPIARITGERGRTTGQLRLFAKMLEEGSWVNAIIDTALPDRQPIPRADIRQMQVPLGPVVVFGASNFPLAFSVAGGDTVAALAAGCPVVFKAHPAHPATCELVAGAIIKAAEKNGIPNGVFSLLHGYSHHVGHSLAVHPLIKAVAFTGSKKGGKALYDAAVQREQPIPVYAEMSSINPVVFLPGIIEKNAEKLAQDFAASVVLGAGQFCTNPGIFFIIKNEGSDDFMVKLTAAIAAKPVQTMLTKEIAQAYCKGIQQQRSVDNAIGLVAFDKNLPTPHLLQITATEFMGNSLFSEEVFGPATIAIVVNNMDELKQGCERMEGQLTATIHGTAAELSTAAPLIDILQSKAGRLVINGFPTGVEVCDAMVHGGPYPATTDVRTTSVGTQAIYRFTRPVCFQDFPDTMLPDELKQGNPAGISRKVNGAIE